MKFQSNLPFLCSRLENVNTQKTGWCHQCDSSAGNQICTRWRALCNITATKTLVYTEQRNSVITLLLLFQIAPVPSNMQNSGRDVKRVVIYLQPLQSKVVWFHLMWDDFILKGKWFGDMLMHTRVGQPDPTGVLSHHFLPVHQHNSVAALWTVVSTQWKPSVKKQPSKHQAKKLLGW